MALLIKYGIAKSTICATKRKRERIFWAVSRTLKPTEKCTLKTAEFEKIEKELLNKWFLKQRKCLSRCFQNFRNPVIYKSTKKAWMTDEIFKTWFFQHFVPEVSNTYVFLVDTQLIWCMICILKKVRSKLF